MSEYEYGPGTSIADYCGCCGGLSENAPKGDHDQCCAEQHDTEAGA